MTLTVSVPFSKKTSSRSGNEYIEYCPESVHDSVLEAQIRHAYDMFRFFRGTFWDLLAVDETEDREGFKEVVASFFSKFIHRVSLNQGLHKSVFRHFFFSVHRFRRG